MLSPQQAAAFAAQMSMFAAAPHSLGSLPGFAPPGPLQAQLGSSQAMQANLLRGVRWPEKQVPWASTPRHDMICMDRMLPVGCMPR